MLSATPTVALFFSERGVNMQKILFIIHCAPYGNEAFFSALRLALQLQETKQATLKLFLMSDAERRAGKTKPCRGLPFTANVGNFNRPRCGD